MQKKKNGRNHVLRSVFYVYALVILLSLFVTASYTWFALSRTPKVSDLGLYVNSPTGLELSQDPLAEEWELQLDFATLVGESAPLRPVTWSEQNQQFFAAVYGRDGRLTDVWEPLNDERHANKNNADGYYIMGTFYARTGQQATVTLSPAVEIAEGRQGSGTYVIGTPLWDAQRVLHSDGGHGAQQAIRIGIRVQMCDLQGNANGETPVFYIYEPNADTHVDGTTGYIATPSIDGGEALVDEAFLITQTTSEWTEAYPVQRDVVIRSLGEFDGETELFTIGPEELAQISLYVWLEGQDVDCTNVIGHEAQVLASIQFGSQSGAQSGLVPIG
ncbi:MAG: hypothetical protein E7446_04765 [Ruminococcaceae bacterium]|nr:hypothetical protein [Oscillospiraceae bacterium]